MTEHTYSQLNDEFSDSETGANLGPSYSSDPNDWCPKHGPHPSD